MLDREKIEKIKDYCKTVKHDSHQDRSKALDTNNLILFAYSQGCLDIARDVLILLKEEKEDKGEGGSSDAKKKEREIEGSKAFV